MFGSYGVEFWCRCLYGEIKSKAGVFRACYCHRRLWRWPDTHVSEGPRLDSVGGANNASASAGGPGIADAGSVSGIAGAGSGTKATVVGDGKAFVPDDIDYVLMTGGRKLTLTAATVISDSTGPCCRRLGNFR